VVGHTNKQKSIAYCFRLFHVNHKVTIILCTLLFVRITLYIIFTNI